MKILILPFLQIPSGHHAVADAVASYIHQINPRVSIKKMDLFHYTSPLLEKLTSTIYLHSIRLMPKFYSSLYRWNAYRNIIREKRYYLFEMIFLKALQKLITEENPNLIICTHCLPSYKLNVLKKRKVVSVPVINIYTDFFINTVWGTSNIDYHFVSNLNMLHYLQLRGVRTEKVAVTGIPVDPLFTKPVRQTENRKHTLENFRVLVSGGNLGVGFLEKLFRKNQFSGKIDYYVLCGKNHQLFTMLKQMKHKNIKPLPYIRSRQKMNELYEEMDLVISKPGGITISECLHKQLPIGLLQALPGQEELNLKFLLEAQLAFEVNLEQFEQSILMFLSDASEKAKLQNRLQQHVLIFENVLDRFHEIISDVQIQ